MVNKLQRTVRIKRSLIKTLKQENSNFPSYMLKNRALGGDIQEQFTKYTSNTPHLSWWHCRRDVTFTPAQNTYCVLTNCTRTTGLHIERLINHIPKWFIPPWFEKVQQCQSCCCTLLSPSQRVRWRCGGGQTLFTSAVISESIS